MNENETQEELVVEDDDRYAMVDRGVIVARDRTALREYQKQAKRQKDKQNEINSLREDVDELKSNMSEIHSMLKELVSRKDNE